MKKSVKIIILLMVLILVILAIVTGVVMPKVPRATWLHSIANGEGVATTVFFNEGLLESEKNCIRERLYRRVEVVEVRYFSVDEIWEFIWGNITPPEGIAPYDYWPRDSSFDRSNRFEVYITHRNAGFISLLFGGDDLVKILDELNEYVQEIEGVLPRKFSTEYVIPLKDTPF